MALVELTIFALLIPMEIGIVPERRNYQSWKSLVIQLAKAQFQLQRHLMKWQHLQQGLDLHHHCSPTEVDVFSGFHPQTQVHKSSEVFISRLCHPVPRKLDTNMGHGHQWKSDQPCYD